MTTQGKTVEELTASNQALRDEIELIGLSAEQQRVVIEQRQMAIILSKEQQLAEMERAAALTGTMTMEHALLQQEIELLRERLGLTSVKASREASADAAKASTSEWQKGVDQIGQSLADQLMQGGQSFGQYLKNLARTLVLKPLIQATVQIAGGALGSLFGAPLLLARVVVQAWACSTTSARWVQVPRQCGLPAGRLGCQPCWCQCRWHGWR